jgi:hypothetical protein
VIFEPERNIYSSTYPPPLSIHLSHLFSNSSKPAAQKSFDCCLSHFRTSVSTSSSSAKRLPPRLNCFTRQKLPTVNRKYLLINTLCSASFYQRKTHNLTLFFGSKLLKHCRHVDYRFQPLTMSMRVCYLDCYEAGLCCYLVMHIENLLRPLQLFFFHLWHIYWLSLVRDINTTQ